MVSMFSYFDVMWCHVILQHPFCHALVNSKRCLHLLVPCTSSQLVLLQCFLFNITACTIDIDGHTFRRKAITSFQKGVGLFSGEAKLYIGTDLLPGICRILKILMKMRRKNCRHIHHCKYLHSYLLVYSRWHHFSVLQLLTRNITFVPFYFSIQTYMTTQTHTSLLARLQVV